MGSRPAKVDMREPVCRVGALSRGQVAGGPVAHAIVAERFSDLAQRVHGVARLGEPAQGIVGLGAPGPLGNLRRCARLDRPR